MVDTTRAENAHNGQKKEPANLQVMTRANGVGALGGAGVGGGQMGELVSAVRRDSVELAENIGLFAIGSGG